MMIVSLEGILTIGLYRFVLNINSRFVRDIIID